MLAFSTDHFHCFQMFTLFLLTRLFAITFVVLFFYKVSPHLSVCPLFIFLEETTGTEQTPFTHLFSLLLGLFGVRVRLNDSYTFVHPSRLCVWQGECPVPCNYEGHICATLRGSGCSSCYNLSVSC